MSWEQSFLKNVTIKHAEVPYFAPVCEVENCWLALICQYAESHVSGLHPTV